MRKLCFCGSFSKLGVKEETGPDKILSQVEEKCAIQVYNEQIELKYLHS